MQIDRFEYEGRASPGLREETPGRARQTLERFDEAVFAADLIRSFRCGLITVDEKGTLRALNRQARQILGLTSADGIGEPVERTLGRQPQLARLLVEAPAMATPPDRAEMEILVGEGQARTIGFTLSRVVGRNGRVRGAALLFKDLTPIEQEQEREQLQERLAALGTMAASLAHEIRNPLAALDLTATLLRRRLGKAGVGADLAETMLEQIRRLSRVVNHALEYVRPVELVLGPVDLAGLLDEAIEQAAPGKVAPAVLLVRRYEPVPGSLLADATRLRQAFLNVVRNALEAMAACAGTLTLSISWSPAATGGARVAIADTGPGIPDAIRSRIFQPFFSTKPQGSGLGLAWTRRIVDAHGGLLDVESRPGEGTVFTLRLPLSSAATCDSIPTGDRLHEVQNPGCRG